MAPPTSGVLYIFFVNYILPLLAIRGLSLLAFLARRSRSMVNRHQPSLTVANNHQPSSSSSMQPSLNHGQTMVIPSTAFCMAHYHPLLSSMRQCTRDMSDGTTYAPNSFHCGSSGHQRRRATKASSARVQVRRAADGDHRCTGGARGAEVIWSPGEQMGTQVTAPGIFGLGKVGFP